MFEELQLALMDLVTPERLFVILEAHRVLMDLGIDDVNDELQQIIGLQDGISDTGMFIDRINDCLTLTLRNTINDYSVDVSDEINLIQLTALIRTVANFDDYLIPDTLVSLLSSDQNNVEMLASIVPLFTELSEEEALEVITEVSDSTITRMRVIADEMLATQIGEYNEVPDQTLRIKRINAIRNQTQGQHPFVVMGLTDNGVTLGQNFEVLISMSLTQLEPLALKEMAYELVGLVYFSNTPIGDIKQTLQESIYEIYDEYEHQRRLNNMISVVYNEFSGIDEVVL